MHMQSSVKLDLEEELRSSPTKKGETNENQEPVETLSQPLLNKATPEYLQELLKDKKQLQNYNNVFKHVEIILEKEITRVRERLFHMNGSARKESEDELPIPSGNIVVKQEKVFVPVKENPTYNFVGRLLGPRGLTAKQLEQDLECKIMVRGQGSMRDKRKEDQNRGKPNWEHLDEELHVLVSVEDYENRADLKLRRAVDTIKAFLEQGVKTPENEDRLKQLQLMELAVLNDKDRQQATIQQQAQFQQQLLLQQQAAVAAQQLQSSLNPGATSPVSLAGMTAQQQLALLQNPSAFLARYSSNPAIPTITSSPNSMMMASLQSQFNPNTYSMQPGTDSLQAAAALLCASGSPQTVPQSLMMPSNSPSATAVSQSSSVTQNQVHPVQQGHPGSTQNSADLLTMANAAAVAASFPSTISAQASLTLNGGQNNQADMTQATNLAAYESNNPSLKMRPQTHQSLRMHPYLR